MNRRDLSLTIALCASLIAHGVLAFITLEGARRQLASIRLPGFPRQTSDTIEVDHFATARLGGATNDGLAPNASPGEETIRAKDASQDQALLSRDPRGPGRIGDMPSDSLVAQDDRSTLDATAAAVVVTAARSTPVLPTATDAPQPFGAGPDVAAVVVIPQWRRPSSPPSLANGEATSNKPAADPAIMSPSESDAFSSLGGIEFRDGRIESRLGRAFKSVRPRLSFAAQVDLMSLTERRIVLKIAIDSTGKVTAVDVVQSTGSELVDQPVKVAMYQWWFEPPKGPNGRAMAETMVFPISWH